MKKTLDYGKEHQAPPCCTTAEAARSLGVSLRTVQLWVDSGALQAWKTVGGHRRIPLESLERLRKLTPAVGAPLVGACTGCPLRINGHGKIE